MRERLREVRKKLGLKQKDVAKALNMSENYIYLVESGKNNLSDKFIFAFCKEYNVNAEWIKTGEGSIFTDEAEAQQVKAIMDEVVKTEDTTLNWDMIVELVKILKQLPSDDIDTLLNIAKTIEKKQNNKKDN